MFLLQQIIEEPVFDILRTKEQLGYDVGSSARNTFGVLGYMIVVNCQANKFSTAYVDERIEKFLVHSQKLLETTSEKELEQIKDDLIKTKEMADVHLHEEVGRNWEEIVTDDYMFDRNQQEIQAIREVSVQEIRDWWNRHNKFGTKENFRKISIQVNIGFGNLVIHLKYFFRLNCLIFCQMSFISRFWDMTTNTIGKIKII